ncbi:uncharacterized protein M6B38_201560 [Iris pallida]|uniref:AB hydrolase-1 domain-containing protein n=1 Tax=Iris pallida TaxID=29817 RepID=A0AAX6E9R9_IRIPA|nr:uncharacterized protein M6B38_201560 [Iris pallida]
MHLLHSADFLRGALQAAATACCLHPVPPPLPVADARTRKTDLVFSQTRASRPLLFSTHASSSSASSPSPSPLRESLAAAAESAKNAATKPEICTADELHYVPVPGTGWKLALWRYRPSPEAPKRNHPLMILAGVGANAVGFDLSPGASFARHMSSHGFDTWIVEVRGAGLSIHGLDSEPVNQSTNKSACDKNNPDGVVPKQQSVMNNGLPEARQNSAVAAQIRDLSQRLVSIIGEGQRSVSPQMFDLQGRLVATIEDFQKQLDLIVLYDWDFDNHLEEDVPAAMEYIKNHSKTQDGKLLAIGHSMGGILLYAMLSRCGFEERKSGLAGVVTLASSVDYTSSKSTLKLLLPLADPAQALNVPVIPLGALLAAAYPLASRPPYVLSWLNAQVSALDMMHPELYEKLILKNFGTISTKVLLQLTTAFKEGGLRDRGGNFCYKDHLNKCNVPVLALAADQDLLCPPEAVYETVKLFPRHVISCRVFGKPEGLHYGHYDLVGGRLAVDEVYPGIVEFLSCHDKVSSGDDSD